MKSIVRAICLTIILLGLWGCGTEPVPPETVPTVVPATAVPPTASPAPTETYTPQPTVTPTPQPTMTLQPTDTPQPTATATIDLNTLQFPENQRLDLNTATQYALLETIPDLDQQLAIEFFANRPYTSIDQFRQALEASVEPFELQRFEQFIYVPIDINASDKATLMQIPGVDEAIAMTLIDKRPFASTTDFLTALLPHLNESQLRVAGSFLE